MKNVICVLSICIITIACTVIYLFGYTQTAHGADEYEIRQQLMQCSDAYKSCSRACVDKYGETNTMIICIAMCARSQHNCQSHIASQLEY